MYGLVAFGRDGAAADYVAVPAADLARKPTSLDALHTATLPLSALTAWQAFTRHATLRPGQSVLIHGAGGGVGLFAVQIARRLGARVLVTATRTSRHLLEDLGADLVIDHTTKPFENEVADVDVVLDTVGGETLTRSFEVVRPGGIIITLPGPAPPGEAEAVGVRVVFFVVEPDHADLTRLAELADDAVLRTLIADVFSLDDAAEAYRRGLAGPNLGKIVIDVAGGRRS